MTMIRSAVASRRSVWVGVTAKPVDVGIGPRVSAHTAYRYEGSSGSIRRSPNSSLTMPSSKAGTGAATTTATSVGTRPSWQELRDAWQICRR